MPESSSTLLATDFYSWLILHPSYNPGIEGPCCVFVGVNEHLSCAKICLGVTSEVLVNFINLMLSMFISWIIFCLCVCVCVFLYLPKGSSV